MNAPAPAAVAETEAPQAAAKKTVKKKKKAAAVAETEAPQAAAKKTLSQPKVKVNPEFRDLLPKKSTTGIKELREDLKEHGMLNPIRVWKDTNEIVDGHNRYEIAKEEGISYKVETVNFPSKDHAKRWILDNAWAEQFTRDPLTEAQARKVANQYLEIEQRITDAKRKARAKAAKAKGADGKPVKKAAAEKRGRSSARAAEIVQKKTGHNFSPAHLETYNKLTKKAPDLAAKIDAGEMSVGKANEEYRKRIGNPVKKTVKKKASHKPAAALPAESEWSESLKAAVDAYKDLSKADQELFGQIVSLGVPF